MGKQKTNPRRRPATVADVQKAYDLGKSEAIEFALAVSCLSLREEFDKLIVHDSWCYYALDYAPTIIEAEEGE